MLGLKLNHVSKEAPSYKQNPTCCEDPVKIALKIQ